MLLLKIRLCNYFTEEAMGIKIRSAGIDDVPFLAQMILQSDRAGKKVGVFDLIFENKNDKEILENLEKLTQTKIKNHCHFSNFLIAESDNKNVGTLCSYEPRLITEQTFLEALKEIGCEEKTEEKLKFLYECGFELNSRTLMFDFVEELQDYKEVGILKALMQKSLLTARLKGYRIAQAVIEIGSLETKLYYEKLGFREIKSKECEIYKEKLGRNGLILFAMEF